MKVLLLHPARDFVVAPELDDVIFEAMLSGNPFAVTNTRRALERERTTSRHPSVEPSRHDILADDLELATLWNQMAGGDEFLFETARRVMLTSLIDLEEIRHRQDVLADCISHPDVVNRLYELALQALENERAVGTLWSGAGPDRILRRSVQILTLHVDLLKQLRQIADGDGTRLQSHGFRRFVAMLQEELSDDYLAVVDGHLRDLQFRHGLLESARLGKGLKGRDYVVRTAPPPRWKARLRRGSGSEEFSFTIPARDENGFRALADIRGRGLNEVANAVAQSADHVKHFFSMLRFELAFYMGCMNLRRCLIDKDVPICIPVAHPAWPPRLHVEGLVDVCLVFHREDAVVGNDVDADGVSLVMVTGANQGGKSTFLRSLGLAQLMMQAGMFVGARSMDANVCSGVFTHFKREEDANMARGKLDEELNRMSAVADQITPHGLLLCNESFASTNEREGSEIARQIVAAMMDTRVTVLFVTHMFHLADGFTRPQRRDVLSLRAERTDDGRRTFRIVEGDPLSTSYGEDSYRRIFQPGCNAQVVPSATGGSEEALTVPRAGP